MANVEHWQCCTFHKTKLKCTYGQLGSILWLVLRERTSSMKSKIKSLILKYLNFSVSLYGVKQMHISYKVNSYAKTQIKRIPRAGTWATAQNLSSS